MSAGAVSTGDVHEALPTPKGMSCGGPEAACGAERRGAITRDVRSVTCVACLLAQVRNREGNDLAEWVADGGALALAAAMEALHAKLAACEAARDEYWQHSVELLRENEELRARLPKEGGRALSDEQKLIEEARGAAGMGFPRVQRLADALERVIRERDEARFHGDSSLQAAAAAMREALETIDWCPACDDRGLRELIDKALADGAGRALLERLALEVKERDKYHAQAQDLEKERDALKARVAQYERPVEGDRVEMLAGALEGIAKNPTDDDMLLVAALHDGAFLLRAMRVRLEEFQARVAELEMEVFTVDDGLTECKSDLIDARDQLRKEKAEAARLRAVVAGMREKLKPIEDFIHGDECEGNPEGLTHEELDCGHECPQCGDDECPAHDVQACFLEHCTCSLGPALRALAILPGAKGEGR